IVRDLFTAKGYKVLEAFTGEEGIEMARREVPDLILLDIQLPKMDGYAVARALKADPPVQCIPIIAVTSYALSGDDKKALDAGCDAYIAKPFKPRELLKKVEEFLQVRGKDHL
ncbi:MAG: response regulator, partial [Nitrospira sp.]|nr:response regulator [Nitrospira sp.]